MLWRRFVWIGALTAALATVSPAVCAAVAMDPGESREAAQDDGRQDAQAAPTSEAGRVERLEQEVEALKEEVRRLSAGGGGETDTGKLAEIERRIEVLAEEIERLKIGEAAVAPDESEHGFGPAASKIYRTERGLSIGGYGEVVYQRFDDRSDDGAAVEESDEFDLLRAVLYFGYKWNDRWLFNSEVEYEHGGEEVGVEFAYLDYLWRPQANLRAGNVLVPLGFMNELHEPTVFLGVLRPQVEQVILPSTWHEDGFGLFGDAGPLSYRTYVVNGLKAEGFSAGEGIREGRQDGFEAEADDLAWVGRLDYKGVPGLLVGGSAYLGNSGQSLTDPTGRSLGVRTRITEGHLEWRYRGLELRALAADVELDDVARLNAALGLSAASSIGERLRGYYLQAGYDLLAGKGGERSLIPFARWESYDTQDSVPAGFAADPANDVDLLTLGLAFKPIDQLIFKADYQNYDNAAETGIDQINVGLGYIF